MSGSLEERQFHVITEGLEIEYAGAPNKLLNVCADRRFIEAKKELFRIMGETRAYDILHKYFKQ